MVKVYQFYVLQDDSEQDWVDPGYKASRAHLDALRDVRIKILDSSEEEVADGSLDPDGRYFPPATTL